MALRDDLMSEIKEAMKAKAADRLSALRLILNGLKEREIALRGDGVAITDADELTVLAKMVKQRQESVKVYLEGARQDLADKEIAEIKVIEEFLPRQLSPAEVEAAIAAAAGQREMALPPARRLAAMEPGNAEIQRFLAQLEGPVQPQR